MSGKTREMAQVQHGNRAWRVVRVIAAVIGICCGALALLLFTFVMIVIVTPSGSPYEDNSGFVVIFVTPIAMLSALLSATLIALASPTGRRTIAFGVGALITAALVGGTAALWLL